jgi:zinc/manganese transport system permease protein
VTSSVALAGVLLVFSFLIIPAAIGVLYAETLGRQLALGWTIGTVASAAGLAASFVFDLPTGAAMVCTFGAALALAGCLRPFVAGDVRAALRRTGIALRWACCLVLAGSALHLMLAPRADQPLLDALEYGFPPLRTAYFSAMQAATYEDARQFAERYAGEAEALNRIEASSRGEGEAIDDLTVRRMSAFLKSYGEMRKGEEFVMREMRSRARENLRWPLGGGVLLLALLIVPGLARLPAKFTPRRREESASKNRSGA